MAGFELIDWRGLYSEGWGETITAEAFAHPAKYSRALIRRIYREFVDRGWLQLGDSVVDPFGGVALGGLDAALNGLHWRGCELEPKFVALGQANIDLWKRRYAAQMPKWGSAALLQGDSRNLRQVLAAGAAAAVSSPPYASSDQNYKAGWARFHNGHEQTQANNSQFGAEYGQTTGNLGAMPEGSADAAISSPPYAGMSPDLEKSGVDLKKNYETYRKSGGGSSFEKFVASRQKHMGGYGKTDGQLGAMPAGNADAAISSPPFLQTSGGANVTSGAGPLSDGRLIARHAAGNGGAGAYGDDSANLGNLAHGDIDAAVSSPPYVEQPGHVKPGIDWKKAKRAGSGGGEHQMPGAPILNPSYGDTPGQLGTRRGGDTFWTAARAIVAETFSVLRPGGHAAWVVKGFVKNKKLVDFPGDWRRLCEAVGFETVAMVRAWVVEDGGTQYAMLGGVEDVRFVTERKSFFRRLAEKNGSPRIDFETVWLMVKP